MDIKLIIFDYAENRNRQHVEPIKTTYKGMWALEEMIKDVITKYYSASIADKILSYLSERRK